MGFWDKVKSAVSKAVNTVKEVVTTIATGVRNFFSGTKEETKREFTRVIDTPPVEIENPRTYVDANQVLAEFSRGCRPQGEKFEKSCLQLYNRYYSDLLMEIEAMQTTDFHSIKVEFPISQIRREMQSMEDRTRGTINKELDRRLNLGDEDCYEIMNMEPGWDKTQRMDRFRNRILGDALDKMALLLKETAVSQGKTISFLLEGTMDQVVKAVANQAALLAEIEKAKDADEAEMEVIKKEITYTIQVCEFALNELEDVNKQIPA